MSLLLSACVSDLSVGVYALSEDAGEDGLPVPPTSDALTGDDGGGLITVRDASSGIVTPLPVVACDELSSRCQPEPEPEPQPQPEPQPGPVPEPQPQPQPGPDPQPQPQPGPDPQPQPGPDVQPGPQPGPDLGPVVQPDPQPPPDPTPPPTPERDAGDSFLCSTCDPLARSGASCSGGTPPLCVVTPTPGTCEYLCPPFISSVTREGVTGTSPSPSVTRTVVGPSDAGTQ